MQSPRSDDFIISNYVNLSRHLLWLAPMAGNNASTMRNLLRSLLLSIHDPTIDSTGSAHGCKTRSDGGSKQARTVTSTCIHLRPVSAFVVAR